jgi:peptide deformylase
MILEVLKYPDPRLREKSEKVKDFTASLKKLSEDMLETMYAERGIGLAAPQVGELVQMLVIDCRPKDEGKARYKIEEMSELEQKIDQPLVIINPVITKREGKTTYEEGCLSVPTFFDNVDRATWIELEYQDLQGNKKKLQTDGLLAIVIQHEMDHLEGTLFIDHLSFLKSNKIKNQIKKNGYPSRELESEDADLEKIQVKKDK